MPNAQLGLVPDAADRHAAIERYGLLDSPTEAAFDAIVRLAAELVGARMAAINLLARDRQWFHAEVGLGVRQLPLEGAFCSTAILQEAMLVVPDATRDPRFSWFPVVTGPSGVRFYAGALLRTPDGVAIGTLCVGDTRPRPEGITALQRLALRTLADQVMCQMELRRTAREKQGLALALRAREEEMRESRADAQAVRARLETISDAGGIGTWSWDIRSGRIDADANAAAMYALAPGQAAHAGIDDYLAAVHPDDVAAVRAGLERTLASGAPYRVVHRVRRGGAQADVEPAPGAATALTVDARGRVEYDADGRPVRVSGVVIDVTR